MRLAKPGGQVGADRAQRDVHVALAERFRDAGVVSPPDTTSMSARSSATIVKTTAASSQAAPTVFAGCARRDQRPSPAPACRAGDRRVVPRLDEMPRHCLAHRAEAHKSNTHSSLRIESPVARGPFPPRYLLVSISTEGRMAATQTRLQAPGSGLGRDRLRAHDAAPDSGAECAPGHVAGSRGSAPALASLRGGTGTIRRTAQCRGAGTLVPADPVVGGHRYRVWPQASRSNPPGLKPRLHIPERTPPFRGAGTSVRRRPGAGRGRSPEPEDPKISPRLRLPLRELRVRERCHQRYAAPSVLPASAGTRNPKM